MELIGKVKVINADIQVSATFKKSELVITTSEQYPQHILIEFPQDKSDLIDKCKVGDDVKVHINVRGRAWENPQGETKYFNSIHGWRIEKIESEPQAPKPTYSEVIEEEADLPF